ncbi:MAG: HAMP domain-containing histidine kinase [Eubacterium sp.]|nr:HAMP domain-containing histidine kinase [Eubacterium sp.]
MKKFIVFLTICSFIVLFVPGISFLMKKVERNSKLDVVEVNGLISEIQQNWGKSFEYPNCSFGYAVLDSKGNLIYKDNYWDVDSIVKATEERDTIRDIVVDDKVVGKLIIYNNMLTLEDEIVAKYTRQYMTSAALVFLFLILGLIWIYIRVVKPFDSMKEFATAVASGDLDKPLEIDKGNVFGAFTESFDIMREELALSKDRELQANISKKELVAQLSHDLKTPVASIKAMSEVLSVKEDREPVKNKLTAIGDKADQIDRLISDLLVSTLEELERLEINTSEIESTELEKILRASDYKNRLAVVDVAGCIVMCDKVRVGQIFSNIIYNSYKYADTDIYVEGVTDTDSLHISITDRGGGVPSEELNMITEKYKRGSNASEEQGAGLGLYISKELMEDMQGSLEVTNADGGFRVILSFRLA